MPPGIEDLQAAPITNVQMPGVLVLVLVAMAVLVAIDLVTDLRVETTAAHVVLELVVVLLGFTAATAIALRLRRSARHAQELQHQAARLAEDLRTSREDAERWRADAASLIAGLGAAIDAQLARWDLTPAEREIALLLLKGLSHKEIATIRNVSETTVRQQARSLYRKAGLSGRSDLAAFFLEDLLEPGRTPHPYDGRARVPDPP